MKKQFVAILHNENTSLFPEELLLHYKITNNLDKAKAQSRLKQLSALRQINKRKSIVNKLEKSVKKETLAKIEI